jgi:hypothetical protein
VTLNLDLDDDSEQDTAFGQAPSVGVATREQAEEVTRLMREVLAAITCAVLDTTGFECPDSPSCPRLGNQHMDAAKALARSLAVQQTLERDVQTARAAATAAEAASARMEQQVKARVSFSPLFFLFVYIRLRFFI